MKPNESAKIIKTLSEVEKGSVGIAKLILETDKKVDNAIESTDNKIAEIKSIAENTAKQKGEKGDRGEKGDKGERGEQGIKGKDGKDGKSGKDGKDGVNGKNGKDGVDGSDGKAGKDGSPDTGEQIVAKINKQVKKIEASKLDLSKVEKDIKELKDKPSIINNIVEGGQGGASGIRDIRAGSGISVSKVNDVYTITNTDPDTTPVDSVTNSDGSLTISPTTGDVIGSLNVAHSNTWTGVQHFNLADEVFTPTRPTTDGVTFVPDGSGFLANGTTYQYYIYSYYTTGLFTAYDNGGFFAGATDPNDSNTYNIELTWSGATQTNGYIIYDVNNNQYIDVGDVAIYTITPFTSWVGGTPTLTPNSITVPHSAAWFQSGSDYFASDFTPFRFGYNGLYDHLRFKWDYAQQHLRFENAYGTIQEINTNIHADAIYGATITGNFTGTYAGSTIGVAYGGTGATSFGSNRVPYMNASNTAMTSTANFAHLTNTSKLFIGNETTATNRVLTLRGMAAQSGNILALENSSGTLLSAFTSDGRLGIGAAPDAGILLHSRISGNAETILESTGGTTPYAGYSLKSTTGKWGMFVGGASHPSIDGDFGIYDWDAGLYRFVIKDDGKVGIRNTAPTYNLTLGNANTMTASGGFGGASASIQQLISGTSSGSYTQLAIQGPTDGGCAIEMYDGSGNAVMDFGMNTVASEAGFINRMTSGLMSFYTHNGTSLSRRFYINATGDIGIAGDALSSPKLRVMNGGNVGIGFTTIGAKLDVNGCARYTATSTVPSATGSGDGLELWYYNGGGGPYGVVLAYNRDTSAYKPIRIAGSDIGFEEGSTRIMTIDGGYVGILTTTPNSSLQVTGSFSANYLAITALRTLDNTDYTVDCTANTFTVTLPTAVGITGRIYKLKNSGTGVITVATTSAQTIDGYASGILTMVQYDGLIVMSNGANWIII